MPVPATPKYLGKDFGDCPPGHRFTLYGKFWEKPGWKRVKGGMEHLGAFSNAMPETARNLLSQLIARQNSLAEIADDERITSFHAKSVSPFVTGLGIEHPLENGMAFLNPYGLPYLPGSGVKGGVRRAAEELRDSEQNEWTPQAIEAMFGKPSQGADKAERGALTFWDVFPQCSNLCVEIMNPHYGEYYQGNESPHDSGNPVPIYFLTVPAESPFAFHVQCDVHRFKDETGLREQWRELLESAFDHAFKWLGFGAKTAVGYGAFAPGSGQEDSASSNPCEWVDKKIGELSEIHHASRDETLRGQVLANAWSKLGDHGLKQNALGDIKSRWKEQGWWDEPPGKAAKKAKSIYEQTDEP